MKQRMMVLWVAAVVGLMPSMAKAAIQFLDINFDSDTAGSAPATGSMLPVITMPGAIGGYSPAYASPPDPTSGTILVQTPQKSAVFNTNPANTEIGALWMDTGFNVASQQVTLGFDINVLQASRMTSSQVMTINGDVSDTAGILFGARIYNPNVANWAFSASVVPTSAAGGVFALRNGTNTDLTTFGSYLIGETHRVTVVADYSTGLASAYLDGVLGLSAYPLRGGVDNAATYSELFMYMNGESGGVGNSLSIDNIEAYDFANAPAVPEPASLLVWSLIAGTVGGTTWWRRRKSAS